MKPGRLLIALLAAGAVSAHAAEVVNQPGAIELSLPLSVRQYGMGGVGVGGNDVLRAWSNPATLAMMERKMEGALVGGKVLAETTMFGIGGGMRLTPELTGGAMIVNYGFSMDGVDAFGDPSGNTVDQSVLGAGILAAYRMNWLRFGGAVRFVRESITDIAASAVAVDVGAEATFAGATAGVALRNAGPSFDEGDKQAGVPGETLPTEIRAGLGYRLDAIRLGGAVELSKVVERDARLGVGVEYWPVKMVALRAGAAGLDDGGSLTLGFTALWESLGFDYGLAIHPAGLNHRLAVSYGFGAAPEPSSAAAAEEKPEPKPEPEPAVAAAPEPAPAPAPKPGAKKLNVAIAELRAENVSAGNAAVIADMLRGELVKTGAFTVVEKQNMDKILAEHAFQQTGCTSEECAVKLGKMLNVQRMVVGSFGLMLDTYMLNIRVINVETGEVAYADSAEGKSVADLKIGVRDLAKRMSKQLR